MKEVIFHKRYKGQLVRVVKHKNVWRCNIFASNGELSSYRFASPGAAVTFAQLFCGAKSNQIQLL